MVGASARAAVASITPATEDPEASNHHVDAFRYIDVRVAKRDGDGDPTLRRIELGLTQIKVQIRRGAGGDRPPAQPQLAAFDDTAKDGRGQSSRLLLGESSSSATRAAEAISTLGTLLQGQSSSQQVLAQRTNGPAHGHRRERNRRNDPSRQRPIGNAPSSSPGPMVAVHSACTWRLVDSNAITTIAAAATAPTPASRSATSDADRVAAEHD
jgi:hypothetical protein